MSIPSDSDFDGELSDITTTPGTSHKRRRSLMEGDDDSGSSPARKQVWSVYLMSKAHIQRPFLLVW